MVDNVINAKNKPHALLVVESKLCDLNNFLKEYMKSIVCDGDNCIWCKKIDENKYFDILTVDGYTSTIKKEEILNIINQFSSTSLESRGIKFYIIKGIEYATKQSTNSLLKFLEEPPVDTYAILTTRSIEMVIPTIKSRCHVITLKSDVNNFNNELKEYTLDDKQKEIIKKIYYSYDDIKRDITNNSFNESYEFCMSFINKKNDLVNIKKLHDQFKEFDYRRIELIIKIIFAILPNENLYKLLDNLKFNPNKTLTFNSIWTILQGGK